jgi:hypothetical protein
MCVIVLAVGLALVALPMVSAGGENVSIAISTPSVSFGLNIGAPPPLVAVPGLPVYQAPSVPDNYFVYEGYFYLFHGGSWYYSHQYNGPWMSLVIHQVPRPILAVPVPYYKKPPPHWKKHGPPPWAPAKGHDRDRGHREYKAKKGPGKKEATKGPGPHEEKKGHGRYDEKKGGHR